MQDGEKIIRRLRAVLSAYRADVERERQNSGVSGIAYPGLGRILNVLAQSNEGKSQAALADGLDIRPQSLSEALVKLETRGWIRRVPDPKDGRKTLVFLTDAGREAETVFSVIRRECADRSLSPLSAEEAETLYTLLGKLLPRES